MPAPISVQFALAEGSLNINFCVSFTDIFVTYSQKNSLHDYHCYFYMEMHSDTYDCVLPVQNKKIVWLAPRHESLSSSKIYL